jgi:hypothetical protein
MVVNLTRLNLSDNVLTGDGLDTLLTAVMSPRSQLTELHLRNNWFGDEGTVKLATAVRANAGLRHLDVSNQGARPMDLSRVDMSQIGVLQIAHALLVCPSYLNSSSNQFF